MSMSTTNSHKKPTNIGSSGNNNYFNNLKRRKHMFDKVLTTSDVGKPSRMVIPKPHAEAYFPLVHDKIGTMMEFIDRNGTMWSFKYVYWKSCGSYVMTRGWLRFVKDKELVAGDTVSFHRGYIPDENGPKRRRKVLLIDWRHREVNQFQGRELGLGVYGRLAGYRLNDNHRWNLGRSEPMVNHSNPNFRAPRVHPLGPSQPSKTKRMRLFGVDLEVSESSIDDGQSSRRSTSEELGASSSLFKQLSDMKTIRGKGNL